MAGQAIALARWRALAGQVRARPSSVIVAAAGLLCLAYALWPPQMPDLAAQLVRTDIARTQGATTWWDGWYGGLSLPTYSLLSPAVMAAMGTSVVGAVAVVATSIAGVKLTASCLRPRLGAAAVVTFSLLDLLAGRVTFAAGVALAAWAAVSLRSNRSVPTVVLSLLAYAASPLAGMFLGVVVTVVAILDPERRRPAIAAAALLLGLAVGTAILFPGTGTMPFSVAHAVPPAACCLAVLVLSRVRVVRAVAFAVLVLFVVCLVVPTPVGGNITRFVWLAAVPALVATAPAPRWLFPFLVCALAVWPCSDVVGQFREATTTSAHRAYYQPLLAELGREQSELGTQSRGQRLELVDTANHWGDYYLDTVPLARGWDRQADVGDNRIFYDSGLLTATSYRSWLDGLAVRWVAVPSARLDYASVAEAALIHRGLDYLDLVWSSSDWQLYQVVDPSPLITGGQLLDVATTGVSVQTAGAATVTVRERWSPYIVVTDLHSGQAAAACVDGSDGWVTVVVAHAESFTVTNRFEPAARFARRSSCGAVSAGQPGHSGR